MCDAWCLDMAAKLKPYLRPNDIVLDVGSRNVNGSCRSILEDDVMVYWGVDIEAGEGVDEQIDATELVNHFGREFFDCVISTEMLEHVRDWRKAVSDMMAVLKVGGLLLLTTRSPNFPKHGYPEDHWRFTQADMRDIFDPSGAVMCMADDMTLGWPCGVGVIVCKRREIPIGHLEGIDVLSVAG